MLARFASFCQTAETTSTGRPNGPEPLYRIRLSSSLNAYSMCLRFGFCHIARSAPEDDHQRAVVAVIRKPPLDCRKRSPGRPNQTWLRAMTSDLRTLNIGHSSGVTSHRQPRQCRGAQELKTLKGTQSDPNYVSRLLARSECLPGGGSKIILTPLGPSCARKKAASRDHWRPTVDTATLKQRLCDVQSAGADDVD